MPGLSRRACSTMAGEISSPRTFAPKLWMYRATCPGPQPISQSSPDPPTAFAKRLIAFKLVINPPGVFVGDLVVALADRTYLVVSHRRKDSGTIMCFERNRRTS